MTQIEKTKNNWSEARALTDGETISDRDQWRFSEQHEWEYFKASVGNTWAAAEWTEGTETRTLSAPIKKD
jgi:hypothetical protein